VPFSLSKQIPKFAAFPSNHIFLKICYPIKDINVIKIFTSVPSVGLTHAQSENGGIKRENERERNLTTMGQLKNLQKFPEPLSLQTKFSPFKNVLA
jgi:hypothetical protein